jgi:hypothetical protein
LKPVIRSNEKRAPNRAFEINFDQAKKRGDQEEFFVKDEMGMDVLPTELIKEALLK